MLAFDKTAALRLGNLLFGGDVLDAHEALRRRQLQAERNLEHHLFRGAQKQDFLEPKLADFARDLVTVLLVVKERHADGSHVGAFKLGGVSCCDVVLVDEQAVVDDCLYAEFLRHELCTEAFSRAGRPKKCVDGDVLFFEV